MVDNGKLGQGSQSTKMGADKYPKSKCPQKLSAQIVCPSPIVWDLDEKKRFPWTCVLCSLCF